MSPSLGRLLFVFLVWSCSCSPAPHTGEIHPHPLATPPNEEESQYDEEITHQAARKYNGTWCPAMQPQKTLDLDQLMGIWHVVEIILHRDNSRENKPPKNPPLQIVEGCPTIHLNRNPVHRDILSLLWNEEAGFLEYRFQMTHLADFGPGYWVSYGPQNGSLTQIPEKPYTQFAGTVQVMKAVHTHMVLTFCSPNSQLYSAVLSRTTPLVRAELRGVHSMLQRRGLQNVAFTETCRSLAGRISTTLWLVFSAVLLSRVRS